MSVANLGMETVERLRQMTEAASSAAFTAERALSKLIVAESLCKEVDALPDRVKAKLPPGMKRALTIWQDNQKLN